jgi:hypothetical protein
MGFLLVFAVAVAVGVLVYRLTAGGDETPRVAEPATPAPDADGSAWVGGEVFGEPREGAVAGPEPPRAGPPEGYIPVTPGASSWHARLGGAMGLVIAVAIGAIALALSLWAVGTLVARLVSDAGSGA